YDRCENGIESRAHDGFLMGNDQAILELLRRVRARWRALGALHATCRAALVASGALLAVFAAAQVIGRSPLMLAAVCAPMLADAASHVLGIDLDAILPAAVLRRTGLRAAGATVLLIVAAFIASGPARESLDAASLRLFPSRVTLQVHPGDARVIAGQPLS